MVAGIVSCVGSDVGVGEYVADGEIPVLVGLDEGDDVEVNVAVGLGVSVRVAVAVGVEVGVIVGVGKGEPSGRLSANTTNLILNVAAVPSESCIVNSPPSSSTLPAALFSRKTG